MLHKAKQILIALLFVLSLLIVVFLFLGLEMSSSYTRASPDCSVWCVIVEKIINVFN
jgi:hypothetical protein